MAQEWSESWKLINEQRVARRGWSFFGSSEEPATIRPPIHLFRTIVQREHARARRRYLRARSISTYMGCGVWEDDAHSVEPSDDEDLPLALPGLILICRAFSLFPLHAWILV